MMRSSGKLQLARRYWWANRFMERFKKQAYILRNTKHERRATLFADIIAIWGHIWNLNMDVENSIYLACRDHNAPPNFAYLTHHLVDVETRVVTKDAQTV